MDVRKAGEEGLPGQSPGDCLGRVPPDRGHTPLLPTELLLPELLSLMALRLVALPPVGLATMLLALVAFPVRWQGRLLNLSLPLLLLLDLPAYPVGVQILPAADVVQFAPHLFQALPFQFEETSLLLHIRLGKLVSIRGER